MKYFLLMSFISIKAFSFCVSYPRINVFDGNKSNLIQYEYRYSIDESKSKGPVMDRWEHRIGEYVKGAYSIVEPDGRIRTVDYEVDGGKGYHAVIRMNEPGAGLLSYQQLEKSMEIFPNAILPTVALKQSAPTRNARNDGKLWNYHSRSPYINEIKSEQKDHKASGTIQISKTVSPAADSTQADKLPPSPVNYNVPHVRKLIHFFTPEAFILEKNELRNGKESRSVKLSERKKMIQNEPIINEQNTENRKVRNSKLVKRFKSMSEFEI